MVHPFLILEWLENLLHSHIGIHVTYTWLVMAILIVVAFLASRSVQMIPSGVQNFMESVVAGVDNLIVETMGEEGRAYFPLIATFALFILTSNLIALIPGGATLAVYDAARGLRKARKGFYARAAWSTTASAAVILLLSFVRPF